MVTYRSERGASFTEYVILLAGIVLTVSLGAAVVASAIGDKVAGINL